MTSARSFWINAAVVLMKPVLQSICNEEFKTAFPSPDARNEQRDSVAHYEALAKGLHGIAPWLELQEDAEAIEMAQLARRAIDLATDLKSSQFMTLTGVGAASKHPLVDSAFLAYAMLRAPTQLWAKLDSRVKANVIYSFNMTRPITPFQNNWVLFASMVEAFFFVNGIQPDEDRLLKGLQLHRQWYLGDGWWGDGPEYVHNYYNSYVTQPMIYDILDALQKSKLGLSLQNMFPNRDMKGVMELNTLIRKAIPRSAAHLETLVAPDGSFPVVGRSITCRAGAFHILSLAALKHILPRNLPIGQARTALTRAINRTLDHRAYDKNGWLRIGVIGTQPKLAQNYVNQGSLYVVSAVFLPLGLSANDPFWTEPELPTTWERVWDLKGEILAEHSGAV
ncbi:hypothetical protein Vretimale_10073 [Volvox reticuliferus]|uniref:DUF2264 domain-containing protein n=1 Tax=Volvox reticuliferus TaxID=1737510 RepID=A0A8J4LQC5_9CHLO|nr:hypothetical protein Vretifemale_770 [Volvox reticuliferus]GIM05611.1 hypothetical protein Vretimale_10073 [Volvox reticuliferus]